MVLGVHFRIEMLPVRGLKMLSEDPAAATDDSVYLVTFFRTRTLKSATDEAVLVCFHVRPG